MREYVVSVIRPTARHRHRAARAFATRLVKFVARYEAAQYQRGRWLLWMLQRSGVATLLDRDGCNWSKQQMWLWLELLEEAFEAGRLNGVSTGEANQRAAQLAAAAKLAASVA